MHTTEVRPERLVLLIGSVLLVTAYLPHPNLGQPLPQTLNSLVRTWVAPQTEAPVVVSKGQPD